MTTLLVANRGEIAARIIRSARDLGIATVAVFAADDAQSLHVSLADTAVALPGTGPRAYLDADALCAVVREQGADLVHPGYGFLAESPDFARAVAAAGAVFVGPAPEAMEALGDKDRAKRLAAGLGVPTAAATPVLDGPQQAAAFLERVGGTIALKAVAGGGGRGIVLVDDPAELPRAFERAGAEAAAGFGDSRLIAEQWLAGARHIEVQALGTEHGVLVLGDRDCSLQRRRQKFLELAPAALPGEVRAGLGAASTRLLEELGYRSLATVEFLVAGDDFYFLEVNPRIQVEHTVTEEVTGLDLVELQLREARGLPVSPEPRFSPAPVALQARISAETIGADGGPRPATGTLAAADFPTGRGVRVDTWVRTGTTVGGSYDPLIAKLIVTGDTVGQAGRRLDAALSQTRLYGVDTNTGLLRAVLAAGLVGNATTQDFDARAAELAAAARALQPDDIEAAGTGTGGTGTAGRAARTTADPELAPGETPVRAPVSGTVVSLAAGPGELGLIEAMKMHHAIPAPPHTAARALVAVGDTVAEGQVVFAVAGAGGALDGPAAGVGEPHPGIAETIARHAGVLDAAHPADVARVHGRARRTARENLADLVVPGTFVEYGPLAIAAQRSRRSHDDLVERTRADGLVGGIGVVDTGAGSVRAVVMSYDYMVLAGTQGARNHQKTDRLLDVAARSGLPVVLFCEGGGGRPGDTDMPPTVQLDVTTFAALAGLRGHVPLVAIVSGRCFAGNAALAGVCDVIIATPEANLGMGGPAMIAGGGLGTFSAEDVGPIAVHRASGAVDLVVDDDAAAVAAAKEYLGLGTGKRSAVRGEADAEAVRASVPADRLRAFDMRTVLERVVDAGSFRELRREHAPGAITGFGRVDGRAVGIIANDNHHLGGAIDVDTARSLTAHIRLVEDLGIPLLSFVDTPGFMVGPAAEAEPGVRAFGDLFVTGAGLSMPLGVIVVRKAYGLGAMAMTAGHFRAPRFIVAWPSGEMGPMGLEGAVELGFAKELAAAEGAERDELYNRILDSLYERGRAMTAAENFDIDDVIDPADTRDWIATLF